MKEKVKELIAIISYFMLLIMTILILIFTLMISKGIAIAIYIIFSVCILVYIYLIISIFIYKKIPETKKGFLKINRFLIPATIILMFFECLVYAINISYYEKYKKICPFTLKDLDLNFHSRKKCILYNINHYSRYSYQYICSFDPSNDLKKLELTKDEFETSNKLEIVRCLPVNNLLNEDILTEFVKEYNDTNNYYCSLVFQPKPNNFVDVKECDKNLRKINYSFLFLLYFQIIYIWIMNICLKKGHTRREIQGFGEGYEERNPYRFNRLQGLISLNRMLNLLRELININIIENMSQSQMSTEKSEKGNEIDDNPEAEKTKNIIIDNHENYEINVNINNLYQNKEIQNESINMDQINLELNSNDIIIKDEINTSNNNT
jgi:hypothetical protein